MMGRTGADIAGIPPYTGRRRKGVCAIPAYGCEAFCRCHDSPRERRMALGVLPVQAGVRPYCRFYAGRREKCLIRKK
ncbi:hypothetical protein D5282_13950 [bacterium 1xD8-48]|nr:hypothetical protein [bacterium 1xD8-48]